MHTGSRQEEVIDHRLTDREWAEEWKHLDHVRKVITFFITILNSSLSVSVTVSLSVNSLAQVFITLLRQHFSFVYYLQYE